MHPCGYLLMVKSAPQLVSVNPMKPRLLRHLLLALALSELLSLLPALVWRETLPWVLAIALVTVILLAPQVADWWVLQRRWPD